MIAKTVAVQHGRITWITICLVIFGVLIYGFTVFRYDYFGEIKRGENGQAAIQMLDQMRRPFLALKQAELHMLQSPGEASHISDIENAIHDGRQSLSEYLEVASYNDEVRKKVVPLEASYEAWVSLELELVRRRGFHAADPSMWHENGELDAILHRNTSAFLTTMDVLGDGEKPIHHDIDAGADAIHGLLASSLTFIAYLIALAFWWERWRHKVELRLDRLAHRDSLTGLANRVLLEDRFSVAIAAARRYGHRLGILYLDLDGFKAVNDELGHDTGDSVLKEVAFRLQNHTREIDTVARVGGDEFVVLMTNLLNTTDARVAADKLQAVLNQPFELRGKPCPLRASIGIAIFPDDGKQSLQLLKHADAAMYEAKKMSRLNNSSLRIDRSES